MSRFFEQSESLKVGWALDDFLIFNWAAAFFSLGMAGLEGGEDSVVFSFNFRKRDYMLFKLDDTVINIVVYIRCFSLCV